MGKRVHELEEAIDKAERMRAEAQERLRFHQRRQNRLSSGPGRSGQTGQHHRPYVGQPGVIPIQYQRGPSSQSSLSSSRLGLLQRRHIPPNAEPEPLQMRQQPSPQQPNPMLLRPRAMSLSGPVGNLGMMVDTTAGVIGQGYTQQAQPTQKSTNSTPTRFFFSRRSKAQAKKSTFSPFGDSDGGQDDTASMSTFATSLLPTSLSSRWIPISRAVSPH